MKRTFALGAAAVLAAGGGLLATSTTASAAEAKATYGGQCGTGYSVVNQAGIGDEGTVFLTYNSATGKNCVVTIRNTTDEPVEMTAYVRALTDEPSERVVDEGEYTQYAGPVYVDGAGYCVEWGGQIDEATYDNPSSNCGSKAAKANTP
ncbi:spore-associated protein A [Streptomyces sp. NPDC005438]|uniref:spore-associated protein A n=1 Tax=Streptomyces sp. NPDC005438 TaxID=3156880 RepID=UPI0033A86F80